jgi:hypothetical protein
MPPVGILGGPLAPTPVAFSEQSLQTLGGVNPTLADILKETERRALEQGIEIEVSEGLRDQGRQAQLVSEGKSQTMNSRHLTGNAVDIHIRNPDGSPNWDFNSYVPVANIANQVATEMGVPDLVWGGDWKTLKDGVHFQIGGPASGGTITRSTKGGNAMPMGLFDMQEEPQTFGERLKRNFQSGELMDRIALAANSLRMNPDPNIAQMIQMRQERRDERSTANRTAQWLMSQNRQDLAQALMTGAIDPKTAVATALQPAADGRTAMIQNYEYWLTQGKTPQEAEVLARAGAGGTTIDMSGGGKFEEGFAKSDAELLGTVFSTGLQAQRNLGRIDQLGNLLARAPQGAEGAMKAIAGEFGVATEGLDDIQAAQALINSLVPEQRTPGSGPMSDADLALFKQSLPRLINQPGGNATILATMKAIAQYDAEGAGIVQRVRAGEITRDQAFQLLMDRKNPLAEFSASGPGVDPATGTPRVRTFNPVTGRLE